MSKKLKNEELKNVSGGGCGNDTNELEQAPTTTYHCTECGEVFGESEAKHENGCSYCPKCGDKVFDPSWAQD